MGRISLPIRPVYLAAALCAVAAQIHAYVIPEHFHEWWGYGTAFLLMVIFQDIYAVLLVSAPRRSVYLLGIAGTVVMLGLWMVSRTVGIPVGASAGEIEPIGTLDVICQLLELGLLAMLVAFARPQLALHLHRETPAVHA